MAGFTVSRNTSAGNPMIQCTVERININNQLIRSRKFLHRRQVLITFHGGTRKGFMNYDNHCVIEFILWL